MGASIKTSIKIRTVAFVSIIAIALSILSFIPNRAYASPQRGRPRLNAARTTFVGDNGQPLRGPFTSRNGRRQLLMTRLRELRNWDLMQYTSTQNALTPNILLRKQSSGIRG